MRRVFIGYDPRQPLSYNVMRHSVESNASKPIAVIRLQLNQLPITRKGATEFTFSRFLVPWLSDFEGFSVFCDEDQVVTGDIHELFDFCEADDRHDLWVMKNQAPFEWPSVMVFRNAAFEHVMPEFVQDQSNALYDLKWAERVGSFPEEWNHCVGYAVPQKAKLYHYTMGIPWWPECRGLPEDQAWWDAYKDMTKSVEWIDLHRNTKHFYPVIQRMLAKYGMRLGQKEKAA